MDAPTLDAVAAHRDDDVVRWLTNGTRDERFIERLRYYKNLCFPLDGSRRYVHDEIGFNYRMPNVLAAIK